MSIMKSLDQRGAATNWVIVAIVSVFLLLITAGFAIWAFNERTTYKTQTDEIVAKEVEIARQQTSSEKDKEFVEKEKSPLKKYQSPSIFGTVSFDYPKTWSAYADETGKGNNPLDGYFHPNFVPGIQSGTAYALRVQVTNKSYDQELQQYANLVKSGKAKVSAFKPTKVSSEVVGARVEGELKTGQKHTLILLPLRDKAIKIYTESDQYVGDFNKYILPSLTFVP